MDFKKEENLESSKSIKSKLINFFKFKENKNEKVLKIKEVKETNKHKRKIINTEEKLAIKEIKREIKEEEKRKKIQEKIDKTSDQKKVKLIEKEKLRQARIKERNEKLNIKRRKKINEKEIKHYKKNNEEYNIKFSTLKKVSRIFLWSFIGLISIRGVSKTLEAPEVEQVSSIIESFTDEYENKNYDTQIFYFSEKFVKDYFTYNGDGVEYKTRLNQYITNKFPINELDTSNQKNSKVIYLNPYKIVDYTNNQKDVYIYFEIEYTSKDVSEDGTTIIPVVNNMDYIVKVPIIQNGSNFLVEDVPVFVSDADEKFNYNANVANLKSADKETAIKIENMLKNFYQSYYGGV